MSRIDRRQFVTGAAAAAALPSFSVARGRRRQDDPLRVAVVGVRSRGWSHVNGFEELDDAKVVALVDVDAEVLARRANEFEQKFGRALLTFADVREVLGRDDVDVVALATPNHLHALHTIWAVRAGKDVYVEKPCSHNLWEGRRMVEEARAHDRIVQVGTQTRSSSAVREAIAWLRAGGLGRPLWAQGLCYKPRKSIGKIDAPTPVPDHVDYDLWSGPREPMPLQRRRLHYDWHWQFPYGNGDLGNQGVHQVDMCRWALGHDRMPTAGWGVGGRFAYEDDGTTPNTMVAYWDYPEAPIVFEVRGLPRDEAARSEQNWGQHMDRVHGTSISAIVHCEDGVFVIPNYSNAVAYDHDGNEVRRWRGGGNHFGNFVRAVATRDPGDLNADVVEGHLSAGLCHLSNDSYRLGEPDTADALLRSLEDRPHAHDAVSRMRDHLVANGIDVAGTPLVVGRVLRVDPATDAYVGDAAGNRLRRGTYREGFEVPEKSS